MSKIKKIFQKKMRRIILVSLLLIVITSLKSQDTTIFVVRGKIFDGETLKPVGYVLFVNKNKMLISQSDTSGKYRILMMKNDILSISCLGYKTIEWTPTQEDLQSKFIEKYFYLEPITYSIGAINIYSMRWKSFVYNMKNVDVEDKSKQKAIQEWITKVVEDQELNKINPKIGIQIVIPTYSHLEIQQKKIQERMKIEELNRQANEKFNPELVSRVTGLQGDELKRFMNFFSFDRDFILKTSEYDLVIIVKQIFEEYQNQKK